MSPFESKNAYWDFVKSVRSERRFIFDGKAGKFLAAVRALSRSRERVIKPGCYLYRAQAGSEFAPEDEMGIEAAHPLPAARMIPDPKHVKRGGRANPEGFAYLYLATDERTALAELRPWFNESLTLAAFQVKKKIKIVDCQTGVGDWGERALRETRSAKTLSKCVWNDISQAFSRPVNKDDRDSAYLPTQILAEVVKAEGFDGLAYRSGLERGTNVVLFDVHVAQLVHRYVFTLKKVRYDFEAAPNYGIGHKTDGGIECITEIHTESP